MVGEDDLDDAGMTEDDVLDFSMLSPAAAKSRLESAYYSVASQTTSDGRIIFANEIEIFPGKELPELASPGTRAYDARSLTSNAACFVLLCTRSALPRVSNIGSYKALRSMNILRLLAAGIVDWAPENRQRFAFVFEKPLGARLRNPVDRAIMRIPEDKIIQAVVAPALEVLDNFKNMDLVHGAVNLENMFLSGIGTGGVMKFTLGECLTSAPSLFQPSVYETIPRSMASPAGRGMGTVEDDLYALGVCVAMLAQGGDRLANKTPEQIARDKIESGSYGALVDKDKLPGSVAEFLRGVLQDDVDMRWNMEDCLKWLEKRRVNPKQGSKSMRAVRPYTFKEKKYSDVRLLADAFARNVPEAAAVAEGSVFLTWLRRNFDDKDLKDRFDVVRDREKGSDPDRFVCTVCMALDPYGPLRYKGMSLLPAGFGSSLSDTVHKGESLQVYGDILSQQLFNFWINQIYDKLPDASAMLSMFEKSRVAINQKILGYGMERALYLSNRGLACMSPHLENFYVLVPSALLQALESISARGNRPEMILDRHMTAFLSVREPKLIDPYIGYLNSGDQGRRIVGVLRVLAGIQRRFSVGPTPGVEKWIISLLGPAIENFNDRDLRQEITKVVSKIHKGDLTEIITLVDDGRVVREDIRRFGLARAEYQMLAAEKRTIEQYLRLKGSFGRATGRQVAMIVSSGLAVIMIALYAFVHFYNHM